jgi:hypothetical protein
MICENDDQMTIKIELFQDRAGSTDCSAEPIVARLSLKNETHCQHEPTTARR